MDSLLGITLMFTAVGAWFTHLFTCFSEGMWGFLIAGAIFFLLGLSTAYGFGFSKVTT